MAAKEIKKKVANAVLYTDGTMRLDNVRISFPHLAKPYAGEEGQEPKFGVVAMMPKDTHVAAKDLVKELIENILKQNDNAKVAADKKFLRNGDDQDREEYEGHFTVSARESKRPACRDKRGNLLDPVADKETIEELFFGGAICHVLIRPWYQDGQKVGKGFGKRVNAGLVGVMFVKDDGTSFGEGRISDTGAWDDVSETGGDGDDADSDDL